MSPSDRQRFGKMSKLHADRLSPPFVAAAARIKSVAITIIVDIAIANGRTWWSDCQPLLDRDEFGLKRINPIQSVTAG
jgi:hypothetical protein